MVLGGLALAWWPDARYTPYRPGERGTVEDQAQALRFVGQGSPLFRSPNEAQQPLPPLPKNLADAYGTAGNPVGATSTPPAGTSGPAGGVAPSGRTLSRDVRSSLGNRRRDELPPAVGDRLGVSLRHPLANRSA